MRRLAPLLVLWLVLWLVLAGIAAGLVHSSRPAVDVGDVAAANDLAQIAARRWPAPQETDFPAAAPNFTVVAADGTVLVARGTPIADDLQAVRERASSLAIERAGTRLGTLYLPQDLTGRAAAEHHRLVRQGLALLLAMGLLGTGYLLWLDRRIVRPFRRLRAFADRVAHGDLEAPLAVDRGQVFGAFTQSFDILRTELARSRAREAAQRQAHKRLIGQLSHDIRTPLASISASTELLQLGSADPKLGVIAGKASQIDALLTDLARASSDELEAMPVELTAVASTAIAPLVRDALPPDWACPGDVEEVMLVADPQRLQQVLDNLVANAVKYGAPPLRLGSRLTDGLLQVSITDAGPGVPDDELPLLTQPHYRASNAAGRPGQGLGLFTAAVLLEAMGGSLDLANAADGFAATLTLALAEGPQDPRRGTFRTI